MGSGLLTDKRRRHKMKLLLSSFLSSYFVIVSGNEARWNKLNEIWSTLQTSQNVPEASDRKIIELFTMSALQNYGCWCRFNTYTPFRGPTMDILDQYCRIFYLNYDCLVNDYGQSCDVSYTDHYNDTITTTAIDGIYGTTTSVGRPPQPASVISSSLPPAVVARSASRVSNRPANMEKEGNGYGYSGSIHGHQQNNPQV